MWRYLCFILVFRTLNCEETTTKNETIPQEIGNTTNKSVVVNSTIEMQRITQPLAQSEHIERTLTPKNSTISPPQHKPKSEFRPSPHLETYYEFNRVPVVPALPEAKHFAHFGDFPQWSSSGYTTEQSWASRVRFPTTSTGAPTAKEQPYQFYKQPEITTENSHNSRTQAEHFGTSHGNIENWNNFENFEKKKQLVQKHQFDFSAPVSVSSYDPGGAKNNFDLGTIEKPPRQEIQGNPWKKIVKFLTAIIPIGLLISALTPTVITVTSVNGTQSRSRAENGKKYPQNNLISSLNYFNSLGCEDRILCELLLSATATQNAEQHIQNLLDTFTEEGKAVEKADEMKKVFAAVRKQDCRPIVCKGIKENT